MRRTRMVTWLLTAALLALLGTPITMAQTASAQSLVGASKECGTYEFDGALMKGRTDSVIAYYDHKEGCYRYKGFTVIGADRENMASDPKAERAWQQATCEQAGQQAVVGHFKYYRGIEVAASSVKVRCVTYNGTD